MTSFLVATLLGLVIGVAGYYAWDQYYAAAKAKAIKTAFDELQKVQTDVKKVEGKL